jgi:quercetin dioxygenase-like cupin family protein
MRGAIARKSSVDGDWRPIFKDREGAWRLLLNEDPETRSRTLVVRYAKGWEVPESLHEGTVEVFVLEGQFQVGAIVYGPGDYFCVPGGVTHGPERALTDTRILVVSHGPLTPGP